MRQLSYVGMLALVVLGTLPLEIVLRTGVYRRWRRLLLTLLPVVPIFLVWDLYAISGGHWRFDDTQMLGLRVGELPVEELLFFLVVPIASVLTLEAVRAVRGWRVGDEP